MSNATIKDLTGSLIITARKLYQQNDQVRMLLTLILEMNNDPMFQTRIGYAEFRRFILIYFRSTFTEVDSEVNNSINIFKAVTEYSQDHFICRIKTAILTVLFEHNKLNYKGDITIPISVQSDTNEMLANCSEFLNWFNEEYEKVEFKNNDEDKNVQKQNEKVYVTIASISSKLGQSSFFNNLTKIGKRNLSDKNIKSMFLDHPIFKNYFRKPISTTINTIPFEAPYRIQGYREINKPQQL